MSTKRGRYKWRGSKIRDKLTVYRPKLSRNAMEVATPIRQLSWIRKFREENATNNS